MIESDAGRSTERLEPIFCKLINLLSTDLLVNIYYQLETCSFSHRISEIISEQLLSAASPARDSKIIQREQNIG